MTLFNEIATLFTSAPRPVKKLERAIGVVIWDAISRIRSRISAELEIDDRGGESKLKKWSDRRSVDRQPKLIIFNPVV